MQNVFQEELDQLERDVSGNRSSINKRNQPELQQRFQRSLATSQNTFEKEREYVSLIDDLRNYASKLESKVFRYRGKIRNLRDENLRLQYETEEIIEKSFQMNSVNSTLQDSNFETTFGSLRKEKEELLVRKSNLEAENRQLFQQAEEEKKRNKKKIRMERDRATRMESQNQQLTSELERLKRQVRDLEKQKDTLLVENERAHRICHDLQSLLDSALSSETMQKMELEHGRSRLRDLQRRAADLEKHNRDEELNRSRHQIEASQLQENQLHYIEIIQDLEKELGNLKRENEELRSQDQINSVRLNELELLFSKRGSKKKELQKQIDQLEEQVRQVGLEKEILQRDLLHSEAHSNQLSKSLADAEEKNRRLSETSLQQSFQQMNDGNRKILEQSSSLVTLEKSLAQSQLEQKYVQQKCDQLQQEISSLRIQLAESKQMAELKSKENVQNEKRIGELEWFKQVLERERRDAEKQLSTAREQLNFFNKHFSLLSVDQESLFKGLDNLYDCSSELQRIVNNHGD